MLKPVQVSILLWVMLWPACERSDPPQITFTIVPPKDLGGPYKMSPVAGRTLNARSMQRVVLFARADGRWWVQPSINHAFTAMDASGSWHNTIHLGTQYAAVVTDLKYVPPETVTSLPVVGGHVLATAVIAGVGELPSGGRISFSHYLWNIRDVFSHRGGIDNQFLPDNVRLDEAGRLHLRITGAPGKWKCAEIKLTQSLGYGTYRFNVTTLTPLEPSSVFSMYTWDENAVEVNHREMDIELSRWGQPAAKNVQFIIEPFYVPANVVRFEVPHHRLTYSLHWSPGHAEFTVSEPNAGSRTRVMAHYTFTDGVPNPGQERVCLGLYRYANDRYPLRHPVEVVVDKFEYLP